MRKSHIRARAGWQTWLRVTQPRCHAENPEMRIRPPNALYLSDWRLFPCRPDGVRIGTRCFSNSARSPSVLIDRKMRWNRTDQCSAGRQLSPGRIRSLLRPKRPCAPTRRTQTPDIPMKNRCSKPIEIPAVDHGVRHVLRSENGIAGQLTSDCPVWARSTPPNVAGADR